MGKPAARIGDHHTCPKTTSKVPHVGGPVVTGSANVFIGGMPAACKGDKVMCIGPPDTIKEGSATVFINGKPAARMGDATAHGGKIVIGCGTVLIGDDAHFTPASGTVSSSQSSSNLEQGEEDNASETPRADSRSSSTNAIPPNSIAAPVIENEPKWLKICANYDDLWRTPLPAENIDIEVDGELHQEAISLEQGNVKNTYSLDKPAAEYSLANKEAGITVLTDLAPQANQVVVELKGVRGIEQQIAESINTIQSDLDGLYHELVDSMSGFQQEWELNGLATLDDGLLAGAKSWGNDLTDLFSIKTWRETGEFLATGLSDSLDFTYNYAEDKYQAITNAITDEHGNMQNVTWISARLYDEVEQTITEKQSDLRELLQGAESVFDDVVTAGHKAQVIAVNHKQILALPQMIANSDIDGIEKFIDDVVTELDPEWAREIKESEKYPLVLALIQEHNTALTFSAYISLILEAIPPNFYAYYGGKYGVYVLLELVLTLTLAFFTLGAGVAARSAMWTAKLAQYANNTRKIQNVPKAVEALNSVKLTIKTITKVTEDLEKTGLLLVKRPLGKYPTASDKTLEIEKKNIERNKKCRICKGDHKTPASLLGEIEYK